MITSLCINKTEQKSAWLRLLGKITGDKINVNIKDIDGVKLKNITYTLNRKNINWLKLDRIIGAQRNHLLCPADINLPLQLGYKRFKTNDFNTRLCTNLGLFLVKSFSDDVRFSVGVSDTYAEHTDLCEDILKYTDCMTVYTQNVHAYKQLSDRLLEECGAVLRMSKSVASLCSANLVIAPDGMTHQLAVPSNCLLLTSSRPKSLPDCELIYGYTVNLPQEYDNIVPDSLDETYFASALYTLFGQYELGSLMPRLCYNDMCAHTLVSCVNLLGNILSKT